MPCHPGGARVKSADPVGHAICVKHALSSDAIRCSAGEIDDPCQLPTFDEASYDPRSLTEKKLVRSDGQFKGAVCAEIMTAVACLNSVVGLAIYRIGVSTCVPEKFAPGV